MATWTQTYSGGTYSSHYQARLTYTESVNQSANTSTISLKLEMRSTGSAYSHYGTNERGRIYVNGSKVADKTTKPSVDTSWVTLCSTSETISHNADGKKTITIGFIADSDYCGTAHPSDKSWTLTTINRYATITSAPNFTDEDNPTITYSNPAGNNVTTLMAGIFLNGSTALADYRNISKTGTSYTFNLTDVERDRIVNAAGNNETVTVYFYIRTIIGGVTTNINVARTATIIPKARVGANGQWKRARIYYGTGGSWKQCKAYYGTGGSWKRCK